jgi:hypothetical protein
MREEFNVTSQPTLHFARTFSDNPSLPSRGGNQEQTIGLGKIGTTKNNCFFAIDSLSHGTYRYHAPSGCTGDAPCAGIEIKPDEISTTPERIPAEQIG